MVSSDPSLFFSSEITEDPQETTANVDDFWDSYDHPSPRGKQFYFNKSRFASWDSNSLYTCHWSF